jgi:FkbM family methyltransferase
MSRAGVWAQYLHLALRRGSGQMPTGVVSLRCPRVELHVHKNPWRLYSEIFLHDCYQPLLPLGVRPRIVDIGANIGLASLYFLTRWPDARLLAYEPNPAAFDLLKRNLAADRFPAAKICLEASAVSDADGTVEFTVPTSNPTAIYASISPRGVTAGTAVQTLHVRTMDAARVFAEPADLVKLDIEGHEYPVLERALPNASVIRSLAIEFHQVVQNQERMEKLLGWLLGDGGYRGVDKFGRPLEAGSRRSHGGVLRFCRREG